MTTPRSHSYELQLRWTGNTGTGTSTYRAYSRSHEISGEGKPTIAGSSDPTFRGDRTRYNPEELLVSALSGCHMLSYLHLCAEAAIVVIDYTDTPRGTMIETADGGGHFAEVVLRPVVTIAAGDAARAAELHDRAHHRCFIASSMNFPVRCEPVIRSSATA